MARYGPENSYNNLAIDGRVLAFTALISILTGLVFGLFPALQGSSRSLTTMLQDSGRAATVEFSRQRLRSLLVVSTVAIALVLLTGAGLMVNTFIRLTGVAPGSLCWLASSPACAPLTSIPPLPCGTTSHLRKDDAARLLTRARFNLLEQWCGSPPMTGKHKARL